MKIFCNWVFYFQNLNNFEYKALRINDEENNEQYESREHFNKANKGE